MQHLAILDKKRKLLAKIISGEKTIESRWYKSKINPWDKIKAGETVYFKESGDPVSVRATVQEVMQFYMPKANVTELIKKYGKEICFSNPESQVVEWCGQRKYAILIRLKEVQKIEPFAINKKGFGLMAAWISLPEIEAIRKD